MPFQAMEMAAHAKALEAEGRIICHLEAGEPAAPPAPKVIAAAAEALHRPQPYTHSMGRTELRRALSRYYDEQHGVGINPDSIVVTMGSSAARMLIERVEGRRDRAMQTSMTPRLVVRASTTAPRGSQGLSTR